MRKLFTFMLLAAALLVSVPSWAKNYPDGTEKNFKELGLPLIEPDLHGSYFGTLCVPQRIVATKGIEIYDIVCVDMFYRGGTSDTTEVARLVVDVHAACRPNEQENYDGTVTELYCPDNNPSGPCYGKTWIDWETFLYYDDEKSEKAGYEVYSKDDYHTVAGAAYFYTACGSTTLDTRLIYVDTEDVASAPVCVNGFHGTFEQTTINSPVTVLTQDKDNKQYLEQVTKVTMPAHRGYFEGNFKCVPWRWNTHDTAEPHPFVDTKETPNDIHYPCTPAPAVPRRVSSNAIAFNVGRDAATGLYQVDFEHPIYLNKETNKRIENGQLIIEAADGTKYNSFGQRVK